MATAEELLELMFSWIDQRERCAEQLKKLADELESLREKCNTSECVGNSVSVVGAACLVGAGAVTLFTGGAAAPLLGLGAAMSLGGVAVSVITKITEHLLSSSTMKEAEKIEKKSNNTEKEIQQCFNQLKEEIESPSAEPDEVDRHIMTELLGAMARRSGLKVKINIRMLDDEPQLFLGKGSGNKQLKLIKNPQLIVGLAGILTFFAFQLSGRRFKRLFAEGTNQLIQQIAPVGDLGASLLQTSTKLIKQVPSKVLKGGGMMVGGVVGLAFALPEAIESWKEMIEKNHVTEASQSLRDTADTILEMSRKLREEFDNMRIVLDKMDKKFRRKPLCSLQ